MSHEWDCRCPRCKADALLDTLDDEEPIRSKRQRIRSGSGGAQENSGRYKRLYEAGKTTARQYQTHRKRIKQAKVPKRLRRLLDAD